MKDFVALAAEAAERLADEYRDSPEEEFTAWLMIALQREAMVSSAYSAAFIDDHLTQWKREHNVGEDVVLVIRRALVTVWAQESAHQKYFAAILEEIDPSSKFRSYLSERLVQLRGAIEGKVLAGVIANKLAMRLKAQIAILIGSFVDEVPPYVRGLTRKTFSEFCVINSDLEYTAVRGYERMIQLARSMPDSDIVQDTTVMEDLNRIGQDERYHQALFQGLAGWPPPAPGMPSGASGDTALGQVMISVENTRALLKEARTSAYGDINDSLAGTIMIFDQDEIARDPLVSYLRQYVAVQIGEEIEDEEDGGAVFYSAN
jgi:hypothetical protein